MHAYRTHVVIVDPDYTVLKGLPFRVGQSVEVVLLEEQEDSTKKDLVADFSEIEWLRSVATNPVFDFLADAEEDIYSQADGKSLKL
ncbi:MAG: hypothetical protein JZU70_09045 [Chlorobium sp.]|jgi:hypothetical protein|nr:hypothetical protein [Chlorobium sp.]